MDTRKDTGNSWMWKAGVVTAMLCWAVMAGRAQQAPNAKAAAAAAAPTPRTADGHPDLSGLWNGGGRGGGAVDPTNEDYDKTDAVGFDAEIFATRNGSFTNFERDNTIVRRMGANKPQYKPQYWDQVKNLDQNGNDEDPGNSCMPPGIPRGGVPQQIVETADRLVLLYGGSPMWYRVIPIDGRKHTNIEDLDGTWNGEGIGHWEGDTMVIDSIGFNTSTWLGIQGYFHSENMHVIEKFTRKGNTLTWEATVDDPDVLLEPWNVNPVTMVLNTNPQAVLMETPPCSERDFAHAVTKEHH